MKQNYSKIQVDTDDNLPLNKPLKSSTLTIIVRSISEENGERYPKIYLAECLHEL